MFPIPRPEAPADSPAVCVVRYILRSLNRVTSLRVEAPLKGHLRTGLFLRALRRGLVIGLLTCVMLIGVALLSLTLLGLGAWYHVYFDRQSVPDLGALIRDLPNHI